MKPIWPIFYHLKAYSSLVSFQSLSDVIFLQQIEIKELIFKITTFQTWQETPLKEFVPDFPIGIQRLAEERWNVGSATSVWRIYRFRWPVVASGSTSLTSRRITDQFTACISTLQTIDFFNKLVFELKEKEWLNRYLLLVLRFKKQYLNYSSVMQDIIRHSKHH